VQKLETGLQEKKKRLAESISGKPGFKYVISFPFPASKTDFSEEHHL
jgi:hypothetical protein